MIRSGIQESGLLIGCLRKLQKWSFNSLISEYRSFSNTTKTTRYINEQYIEIFDLDLVSIPSKTPGWLNGRIYSESDFIKTE